MATRSARCVAASGPAPAAPDWAIERPLSPHPPHRLAARFTAALAALAAGGAWAQAGTEPAPAERTGPPDLPLWEAGVVALGVSQQAYPGSDQNVRRALVLPFLLVRGRVLRADREGAGLRAVKTPDYEVDIGAAASFGSRAGEVEARRGMAELGTLVELGPRLKWLFTAGPGSGPGGGRWQLKLPLRGVFDLSERFAHRGLAFEPELEFTRRAAGGWRYDASLGAVVADRRLSDLFYGVRATEATATRGPYEARAGLLAWRLGVSASHALTPDWRVFGFVRLDSVAGAANAASPLVRQRQGATAGFGLAWTGWRSQRAAVD